MMLARDHDSGARLRRVTGSQLGKRQRGRQQSFNQHFNHATSCLDRAQPCVEHLGIVKDQQIARLQQRGQFGELAISRNVTATVEQTTRGALSQRVLGDQLRRQCVVKIGKGIQGRVGHLTGAPK